MKDRYLHSCFIVCFVAILTIFFIPCDVDAVIGNCHSYTYWMLSGKEYKDVSFGKLQALLNKMMYKGFKYGPNIRIGELPVKLESGDVVTFGDKHSGFVIKRNTFSHIRKTAIQTIDKSDNNSLLSSSYTYAIDTSRLHSYPSDYIIELLKQGATQTAIDKKQSVNPPRIGFYVYAGTFQGLYNRIPKYINLPVTIWKQPLKLVIKKDKPEFIQGDIAHFSAHLSYSHLTATFDVTNITKIFWKPDFVNNGNINTAQLEQPQYTIEAVAPKISRPWGLADDFAKQKYKGRLYHSFDKYRAYTTLIVKPAKPISSKSTGSGTAAVPPINLSPGRIGAFSETEEKDNYPEDIQRLFVDPPTKTTTVGIPVAFRASLWFKNGSEADVTDKASWTGAPGGVFTPTKRGTFTVKAAYGEYSESATIHVRDATGTVYDGKPPISHADDVNANVPKAGQGDYKWYVLCNKKSGDVVYSKYPDPIRHHIMAGPFPGPRTSEKWIMGNCPRARCTTDGQCAKGPAKGGKWHVVCNKKTGAITFTKHRPSSLNFRLMAGGFRGEPEARLWQEQNCPMGRCDSSGQCAESPIAVRPGQRGWYVTCYLPTGNIEVGKKPINYSTNKVLAGPYLGEPDARLWVDQNFPSWRCDNHGSYVEDGFSELSATVGKPKKNTKEKSEFAEIGGKSTRKIIRESSDATIMSHGGQKGFSLHNFDNNLDNIMGKEFQKKRAAQKKEAQEFLNEFSKKTLQQAQNYYNKSSGGSPPTDTTLLPSGDNSSDTGLNSGDDSSGTGLNWDACVKKFCPICGDDDYSFMGVSTDSQCEDCKTKNRKLIDSCSKGGSAAQRPDADYKSFEKYYVYLCIKRRWNQWSKVWEERFKCHCVGPGKVRPTGYIRCERYSGPHTMVQCEFNEAECADYWEGKTRIRPCKKW